jgi:hypothetical protein
MLGYQMRIASLLVLFALSGPEDTHHYEPLASVLACGTGREISEAVPAIGNELIGNCFCALNVLSARRVKLQAALSAAKA